MASKDFIHQLQDYRLTTAEIVYHLPDYPDLLQQFIWQELDIAPQFPQLTKFLRFWETNLDGRLHSVKIAHTGIITPAEMRFANGEFRVH